MTVLGGISLIITVETPEISFILNIWLWFDATWNAYVRAYAMKAHNVVGLYVFFS